MKYILLSGIAILAVAACATEPEAPAPQKTATLDEAVYRALVDDAYDLGTPNDGSYEEWEAAYSAILAREDLTAWQRAETYLWRGTTRGIFVNQGPKASPYCAVADYDRFAEIAPDHPKVDDMQRDRTYQVSRYQYFTAPENCE